MSSSIFDISYWQASTQYSIWDIVKNPLTTSVTAFYYCKVAHTSASSFSDTNWYGRTTYNSVNKPHFVWTPSINSSMDLEPKVKLIKFGDGYEQRIPDGINNTLLKFSLPFNGRALNETTAIIHFLKERAGTESFVFTPYSPFGKAKLFKCPNFRVDYVFFNNYNIQVDFQETSN